MARRVKAPKGKDAKTLKVACLFCPCRCGAIIRLTDGRILKVEGDPEHPVSMGWTCAKGRAATARSYREGLYDWERLLSPARR
ncbi:MAG: hypothetical protein ACE5LX_00390 [Nitrospinota bacterium]